MPHGAQQVPGWLGWSQACLNSPETTVGRAQDREGLCPSALLALLGHRLRKIMLCSEGHLHDLSDCQNPGELQLSVRLHGERKAICFSRSRRCAQRSRSARGELLPWGRWFCWELHGPREAPHWQQLLLHQEPPVAPLLLPQRPPSSLPGSATPLFCTQGGIATDAGGTGLTSDLAEQLTPSFHPHVSYSGTSRPPPVLVARLRHQNLTLLQCPTRQTPAAVGVPLPSKSQKGN